MCFISFFYFKYELQMSPDDINIPWKLPMLRGISVTKYRYGFISSMVLFDSVPISATPLQRTMDKGGCRPMVQCYPSSFLIPLCILSLSEREDRWQPWNPLEYYLCFYDMNLLYCECFIFEHQGQMCL
jgi:hypothetical protein